MATRSLTRFRGRSRGPRKRAVWVNIPFSNVVFTESVGNQVLLVPEDWEASFTGLSIESATLRAVVGQLSIRQTAAGTAGNVCFWGLYLRGALETAVPVFTTTGMSTNQWLWTGCRGVSTTVTDGIQMSQIAVSSEAVNIKAKRKLTSATELCICAQFGADAATPAGTIGGLLRFLVARD